MLLSEKTIDLLDEGRIDELVKGSEFTRQKFLKGGGALVVGFSFVGSALAGSAKGASARVAAGPPDAAKYRLTLKADGAEPVSKDVDVDSALVYRVALIYKPKPK